MSRAACCSRRSACSKDAARDSSSPCSKRRREWLAHARSTDQNACRCRCNSACRTGSGSACAHSTPGRRAGARARASAARTAGPAGEHDARLARRGARPFRRENMAATATPYSPLGVRLAAKPALQPHPLFLEGKVEVQDEASQILAWLVAPRRREMVVDFCAGAGGKTLALGALMRSTGRLYAFDTSNVAAREPGPAAEALRTVERPPAAHRLRARQPHQPAGRQDRPRAGRCPVQRAWHAAPQPRPEMAAVSRAGRSSAPSRAPSSPRRAPGEAGRPARVRDLQPAGRGERRGGGRFPRGPAKFRTVHAASCWRARASRWTPATHLLVSPHAHGMDGFFAAALERRAAAPAG